MTFGQLTIDGGEVELSQLHLVRPSSSLTEQQRAILHEARHVHGGTIRSVQAGVIMHRARGYCGTGAKSIKTDRAIACCGYASADGTEAVKRLEAAGLLARIAHGLYAVNETKETTNGL